jgi:fatty acid desaturase
VKSPPTSLRAVSAARVEPVRGDTDGRGSRDGDVGEVFRRTLVGASDSRVFVVKLVVAAVIAAAGVVLALSSSVLITAIGVLLLAAVYTHAVELQHQCLHHSAFRTSAPHRWVGVPLGLPMLVAYSHYRVRHLQHHRYLGTPKDSEFFGFDTRRPLRPRVLLRGMFDYWRIVLVLREVGTSVFGHWRYTSGQIGERSRRHIITEYRLMGVLLVVLAGICAAGGSEQVLRLWLLPLAVATPIHFLVELPEHVLCETDSTDVFRNTRSITGSRFSTWFTNGNNLHVEHHAAMNVPLQRLPQRHPEVVRLGRHVERSYLDAYRLVVREAFKPRPVPVGGDDVHAAD